MVQLLREKRKIGFKELHQALKISVGALYHHLDMLEGIVTQDPDRKYVLTDQGRSVVETLSISELHPLFLFRSSLSLRFDRGATPSLGLRSLDPS